MVAVLHLGFWAWVPSREPGTLAKLLPDYPHLPEISAWAAHGWAGVEIFFVISGYVIAGSAQGRTAAEFFWGRVKRLVPGLWVCTAIGAAVLLLFEPIRIVAVKFLLSAIVWPLGGGVDGVVWTLFVEIIFYGWVWLLLVAKRPDWLLPLGLTLAVLSTAYLVLRLSLGWSPSLITHVLPLRFGCYFGLGIGIWALFSLPRAWMTWTTLMLGFGGGLVEVYLASADRNSLLLDPAPAWPPMLIWACACLIIGYGAYRATDRSAPWIRALGLTTYPLYLLHQLVGGPIVFLLARHGVNRYAALAAGLLTAIVLAALVATKIERRLQRYVPTGRSNA